MSAGPQITDSGNPERSGRRFEFRGGILDHANAVAVQCRGHAIVTEPAIMVAQNSYEADTRMEPVQLNGDVLGSDKVAAGHTLMTRSPRMQIRSGSAAFVRSITVRSFAIPFNGDPVWRSVSIATREVSFDVQGKTSGCSATTRLAGSHQNAQSAVVAAAQAKQTIPTRMSRALRKIDDDHCIVGNGLTTNGVVSIQ